VTLPHVFLEGIELWAPHLPGWTVAGEILRGAADPAVSPARRPLPELLPAPERRRAPDTVALALEVARVALSNSAQPAGATQSVFTSAHGDLGITDYMCTTLASQPRAVSPTKFLNSVHNAAAGYWGMATGCMQSSMALSAFDCSFANGLLEALALCTCNGAPVLLVGVDIAATGPLTSTNDSVGQLAAAMVLAPIRTERARAELSWSVVPGPARRRSLRCDATRSLASNAMADALPLFEVLARQDCEPVCMPLGENLALCLQWAFLV
jgi:hypothetical protein